MASISPECTELKRQYDECFNKWYSTKFLQGDVTPECDDIFRLYRGCVWKAIKEKNVDQLINDARKERPFKDDEEVDVEGSSSS
ncbi:Mitochondrial distribution and morphology protein 35 [Rhizophlyctis rosea]|uniref:Mitochondrial distribution and morphology protein 35 n=1 Tax=Rhizophlyctis rosea TaxID=64517 RepID=A0AAD5S2E6_9FUNG|nr:Mitochondrial distribution and morphology protein 35 [Rhizophlyctis rosea]